MNKLLKKTILGILFSLCLVIFSCSNEKIIYVATDGDDNNSGNIEEPLATPAGARDAIRKIRESGENYDKISVVFKEGRYAINSTLEFAGADSGAVSTPITYKGEDDKEVIFCGGRKLSPSDFSPVEDPGLKEKLIDEEARDKVLMVNLKELGITDYGQFRQHGFSTAVLPAPMELIVDNQPQTIARWPNKGTVPVTEVVRNSSKSIDNDFSGIPGIIKYDYDRAEKWNNPEDIWLWGYFAAGFADDNLGIERIDTENKTIYLKHPHMFGMVKTDTTEEWGARIVGYHAYNIFEEIDTPGEYYIDREKGILYYYPDDDFEEAKIVLSNIKEPLIAVEYTSNIHFSNIVFENGKGIGVYIEGGRDVLFEDCIVRNFGTVGAMFGQGISGADYPIHEFTGFLKSRTVGNLKAHHYANSDFENNAGTNHGFTGCKFYNLGTGAIVLSGGDRKTLAPAGNYIENSEIYDFNRWNKTYSAGITLYGVGNIIRHNYIHDAPHQAIAIFGNEHLMEYNRIENVVMEVHDMGAIYMGRNPSERGNVVRYNYIAHNGTKGFKNCGIHVDDGASDLLIEGNVFYKTSWSDFADILLNGGLDNVIRNNIFIDGSHTLWIEDPRLAGIPEDKFNYRYLKSGLWGRRMFEDIDMNSEAWREKYPDFEAFDEKGDALFLKGLEFYNNVTVNEPLIISKHDLDTTVFEVYRNNYITEGDPGFVNMEEENFALEDNSIVFEKVPEFEPIPFEKIGLKK